MSVSLLQSPRRITSLVCSFVLVAQVVGIPATAQGVRATSLQTVQVVQDSGVSIVTLEADGPLPDPIVGEALDPPRFFLDFPDIVPDTRGATSESDPRLLRVRVALNSTEPRVTRVVLDLRSRQPVRVDADRRSAGRVRIFVGVPSVVMTPSVVPVPPLPMPVHVEPPGRPPAPPEPAMPEPAMPRTPVEIPGRPESAGGTPTAGVPPLPPPGFNPLPPPPPGSRPEKPPEGGGDDYKAQIDVPLNRLRSLRPILASIDALNAEAPAGLPTAIGEIESIRQKLAAVEPPRAQAAVHDMLKQSCGLAQMALKLRGAESDAPALRNAASAAAGALLLLDRACVTLGCDAPPAGR
jgi:hypothetical protein